MIDTQTTATIHPPAKLNLFLELVARRADGYHEIDTVMAGIDWCDQLSLSRIPAPTIELNCCWVPSRSERAKALELPIDDALLDLPDGESNLVHLALTKFMDHFGTKGGFRCDLEKSIPAGAGMGGASSDAAAALLAAASLCGIEAQDGAIRQIAASIGSDVPFFLGQLDQGCVTTQAELETKRSRDAGEDAFFPARATGTGTEISPFAVSYRPLIVCAFPKISLSTAAVYRESSVPEEPLSAIPLIKAWQSGSSSDFYQHLSNRLAEPAMRLAPQIAPILETMRRTGARGCQLTGSGSACFALADDAGVIDEITDQLAKMPGVMVRTATFCSLPAPVVLTSSR